MNLKIVFVKLLLLVLVLFGVHMLVSKAYDRGWNDGLHEGIDGACKGTWARNVPWQEQVGCEQEDNK